MPFEVCEDVPKQGCKLIFASSLATTENKWQGSIKYVMIGPFCLGTTCKHRFAIKCPHVAFVFLTQMVKVENQESRQEHHLLLHSPSPSPAE